MSNGAHDVFALVICFWDIIRGQNMQFLAYLKLFDLFDIYGSRNKIITYAKDEDSNLKTYDF
jgi:hypothetical protein